MQNNKKRENTINFGAGPAVIPDEVLKTIKKMKLEFDVAVLRNNKVEFII